LSSIATGSGWGASNAACGRLRDECLNDHWFLNLAHAQTVIEAWRREYNEERPKKVLGGLTPAAYAKQLAKKSATVATGL
jgi:putative transposase